MDLDVPRDNPVRQPDRARFAEALQRLQRRFEIYAATSPAPLAGYGVRVTPELRYQCELYLPLEEIRRLFYRYYRASLCHAPILGSTPFATALSWADCLAGWAQQDPNPARLLDRLLLDPELHERFIYASFLPLRFSGPGFCRYPGQLSWLRGWLEQRRAGQQGPVRCLDAACGSGEGSWELLELASETGWQPQQLMIDGWTLDPLEVYAARQRYLPHAPRRQAGYRQRTGPLLTQGWAGWLRFQAVDLLGNSWPAGRFELIVCNGLLGGPLLHRQPELQQVVAALAGRLQPGGWLLAADRFHGGWQRQVTGEQLAGLFRQAGLVVQTAGEGIAGQRSRP